MLIPNYSYWFSRYLRRPLTPVESAIITRLERQRSHGGRIRIIIDDPHADTAPTIRDLLTLYLQWLNRRLYPNLTAAISAPHLPEARRAARTISPDTLYTSGRSADSLRGHSFHLALMLDAHRYPQRDLYHLARNTRIPDSQLPACWQGKPLRDLPPRDSFESVFRTLAAAIPLQSPCNIIILHADLSRARRRSHIHTLHQQTIHGHTSYHLLHLPNKSASTNLKKTTRKRSIPNSSLLIPNYDTIRDLRTLVGGATYYLEPPHKKPIPNSKFLIPNLSKLLPFHNRPWYIDPKQRPPLHTPHIEHLPLKTPSIGARATRGEGILPSYKKHPSPPFQIPNSSFLINPPPLRFGTVFALSIGNVYICAEITLIFPNGFTKN